MRFDAVRRTCSMHAACNPPCMGLDEKRDAMRGRNENLSVS